MKFFDFINKPHNPMNDLVADLCFGISLYRKAAFHSPCENISHILLELADYRENVLAQLRPYASVWEHSPLSRQKALRDQNRKVAAIIEEMETDQDWFIVRQVEAKTVEVFETAQKDNSNTLVIYLLQKLAADLEGKLDSLIINAEEKAGSGQVA